MTISLRAIPFAVLAALWATAAGAQTPRPPRHSRCWNVSSPPFASPQQQSDGDTGLWYVPDRRSPRHAAMVRQRLSPSALNYIRGFHATSATFPLTFAFGMSGTAPKSSARSCSSPASTATCGRSSPATLTSAASSAAIRRQTGLDRQQPRRLPGRRQVQPPVRGRPEAGGGRGPRRCIKLPTGDKDAAPAPARPTASRLHRRARKHSQTVEVSGYGGFACAAAGRRRVAVERIPMRRRRRLPVAQPAAAHHRVQRRAAVRRHGDTDHRRSWRLTAASRRSRHRSGPFNARDARPDVADSKRVLHRRRHDLDRCRPRIGRSSGPTRISSGDFVDYQFRIGYHPASAATCRRRRRRQPPPAPPPAPRRTGRRPSRRAANRARSKSGGRQRSPPSRRIRMATR